MNTSNITSKDLLLAYKVITKIMDENNLTMDTSFRRVQSWLSNTICDQLTDKEIIE